MDRQERGFDEVKRCKHLGKLVIEEAGTGHTSHVRDEDGTWSHNSDFDDYTGFVWARCFDCGLRRRYNKNRPKWLKVAIKKALAEI